MDPALRAEARLWRLLLECDALFPATLPSELASLMKAELRELDRQAGCVVPDADEMEAGLGLAQYETVRAIMSLSPGAPDSETPLGHDGQPLADAPEVLSDAVSQALERVLGQLKAWQS